jgi:hypothetical protein
MPPSGNEGRLGTGGGFSESASAACSTPASVAATTLALELSLCVSARLDLLSFKVTTPSGVAVMTDARGRGWKNAVGGHEAYFRILIRIVKLLLFGHA